MAQYPHVFEDAVMDTIKNRVMDDSAGFSGEDHSSKHEFGKNEASDFEMLKTYSTGLLAYFLAGYACAKDILFFPFSFYFYDHS